MKKIIFTVFSILIILTTIFFIAIGTVRDSRYYILILVYIIAVSYTHLRAHET